VYRHDLKSELPMDGNIVDEVSRRLGQLCRLHGIDEAAEDWERQLLMTILHRHVPGFQFRAKRRKAIDAAFLIETIEGLKSHHESLTGQRPSTDAVVQEIAEADPSENPFAGMSHSRMMRIYSGRTDELKSIELDAQNSVRHLVSMYLAHGTIDAAPTSHAALLVNILRRRAEKP
jgi:hypothetical protein